MTPRLNVYQITSTGTPTASAISITLTLLKEASAIMIVGENPNTIAIKRRSDAEIDVYAKSRKSIMTKKLTTYTNENIIK